MKTITRQNSDTGSALVLVLLITALLSTITVSFLSTSRVEQTASQNLSRQNAAHAVAEIATQEAMSEIQRGFNSASSNGTSIVITQPGRIMSFTFPGASNSTAELFTTSSNLPTGWSLSSLSNSTVDLNQLARNNTATTTITGNTSESIVVPLAEFTQGNITCRYAFYVDDEGTKLNLNTATNNRSALNISPDSQRQTLITAISGVNAALFGNITTGTVQGSSTSNVTNWAFFFRPEQAKDAPIGVNATTDLPNITTAVSANASATSSIGRTFFTKTPWGTDRLFINTLSTNATNGAGDASVNTIHAALTNATLSSIFGGNFATKYTSVGVKQIAANMLQMRDPNTATVNASFSYQGPLIGAGGNNSLDPSSTIPKEYLGFAPYPVVSELSMDVCYNNSGGNSTYLRPYVRFNIELYNPYPVPFNAPNATLEYNIRGLTWNMSYTINSTGQSFGPHRYGGYGNWTDNSSSKEHWSRADLRDRARSNTQFPEAYFSGWTPWGAQGISIPAYSKVKYNLAGPNWGTYGQALLAGVFPFNASDITITSFTDVRCAITYVKILANSIISTTPPNPNTVRDWVMGAEVGPFIPNNGNLSVCGGYLVWKGGGHQMIPVNTPIDFPRNGAWAEWLADNNNISRYSYQRLCPLIKTTIAASSNLTASTRAWTENASIGNQTTFGNISSAGGITTTNSTEQWNHANANPSFDSGNNIPSDPSYNNFNGNAIYANATQSNDMRIPELPSFSGNYLYTCPADLGLVPTNQRWRRLRMQPQPATESTAGLIPDWAMLDVISFGTNATTSKFMPVNLNGKFHVPAGSPQPMARDLGIKSLAKVIDSFAGSGNVTIQDIFSNNTVSLERTKFLGTNSTSSNGATIAANIANMAWSSNSSWNARRNSLGFPASAYLLPSEIIEVQGVADTLPLNYSSAGGHFKRNEGRISALLPGFTTRSNFFTIYAYGEVGKKVNGSFQEDGRFYTKTLVEVEGSTGNYKVKKLYTQTIPLSR